MSQPGCLVCGELCLPGRGVCTRCNRGIGRVRGQCSSCGKPDRLLNQAGRCRWCWERAEKRCADCHCEATALIRVDDVRVCDPCALRHHLDRVLPAEAIGALQPLREVILRAEPLTTRRWLDRTHDLLVDLRDGRVPLEHAALDALPRRKAVEHLRALLIATGILPPDPGRLVRRLEADLPNLLRELDRDHQQLAARWVRWAVLPRLRRMAEQERDIAGPAWNARRKIEQVAAFLTELQRAGRELSQCTQHDIDDWFAGPGAIRWVIRPFLSWAHRNRHLTPGLSLPPSYKGKPVAPADPEHRWQLANRLITDDTLDPVDRVAGALVVLYAQPIARIVTLSTADVIVTDTGVSLTLGTDALELPEPFASLIRQLPCKRRESTADQLPNRWLFAGGHADQHLTTTSLTKRLNRIGIQAGRMRLAAADQLAREIPPAMLAGILGLKAPSVARLTTQTKGQWANYAATR